MRRPRMWREPRLELPPECREADALRLREHQIRERRRKLACVIELDAVLAAVRHRSAGIEHQRAAEVRLLVILLDVRTIGSPQHTPVESPRFVAGNISTVLTELDA